MVFWIIFQNYKKKTIKLRILVHICDFRYEYKDLGRFIIQICPTYNDERCSRHMLIKINIYCQYIILTIWKHDTFCWMTTTFIEKNW